MPKIKKRGEAGQAKNYITRTQAVKKLQLSLPDFRKLCIWKGIYPREPRNKKKVSRSATASTTFYYTKDIQYLLHEPLLQKFREQKALEKKISRALGRGDVSDAQRFERHAARPDKTGKPRFTLDHVVRERYPTFVDALRDLDDCLCMLFLFANLPSTSSVPARMIARCERLCLEFQHYLIVSHSLRKSFLSIKGIYYQANIRGEDVLWVVPYKFNQRVVGDVDFRIMGTFVEFYMTLLGFVNHRLYTSIGLKYPPRFDQGKDEQAAELGAFTLEGVNPVSGDDKAQKAATGGGDGQHGPDPRVQAEVDKLVKELKESELGKKDGSSAVPAAEPASARQQNDEGEEEEEEEKSTDAIDKFEPTAPGGDVLPQPSSSFGDSNPSTLFANCTFFLSRETPRQPLEFILRAFGCRRIGWDAVLGDGAYTTDELDPSITHQIVDRPVVLPVAAEPEGDGEDNQTAQRLSGKRVPGRIYVQPQWVWDSVNDEEVKDPAAYAPGAQLPPHLSPFVKSTRGQYDPTVPLEQQETEAEALATEMEEAGDGEEEEEEDEDEDEDGDEDEEEDDEEDEDDEEEEDEFAVKELDGEENGMDIADDDDDDDANSFGGFSDGDEDGDEDEAEESAAMQRQRELEAEISGRPAAKNASSSLSLDPKAKARLEAKKALEKKAREEAEELERAKGMLSKKKRKLFEQMQYTNSKKSAEDMKLRAKRRKIEKELVKKKGRV